MGAAATVAKAWAKERMAMMKAVEAVMGAGCIHCIAASGGFVAVTASSCHHFEMPACGCPSGLALPFFTFANYFEVPA